MKSQKSKRQIVRTVFRDIFWRDVVYAFLPLIVIFFITLLNEGPITSILSSILVRPEWLFAAIVFLGLTIATVSQQSETSGKGKERRDTPAAPYLFVVIGAAVLLGVVMYEKDREQQRELQTPSNRILEKFATGDT